MSNLLNFLSTQLGVKIEDLALFLSDETNYIIVDMLISNLDLKCNYGNRRSITYGGLTRIPACRVYAFQGYLGVKLPQYFYCKYRIRINFPNLPCVIVLKENGHKDYIPIELIK